MQRKITFLIPAIDIGGGAERVCTFLANKLHERGYSVTIQLLSNTNAERYPLDPGIQVCDPPSFLFGIYGAVFQYLCRCFLRRKTPDVVISFLWPANVFASILARFTSIKVILTERSNLKHYEIDRKSYRRVHRNISCIKAFIVQTAASKPVLEKYLNIHESKITVIFNPVVPESFETDENRGCLLAAGRLVRSKGFDRLLRMFSNVHQFFPQRKLLICGAGPEEYKLKRLTENLNLEDAVIWCGNVVNISEYYRNADVFLMTSHYEGMPNAMLEAMANGCPVISFDFEYGPSDIITDGVDGLLIPQDDEDAFIKALTGYLKDPEMRKRFVKNIPEKLKLFDPEKIADQWEEVINGK